MSPIEIIALGAALVGIVAFAIILAEMKAAAHRSRCEHWDR